MSERDRRLAAGPQDRANPPSAVRVIPAADILGPPAAASPTSRSPIDDDATVLRPEHFDQLTGVVDQLRSGQTVRLRLDGFADRDEQQRAWAFVHGAAYALSVDAATAGSRKDTIVLDPCAPDSRPDLPDDAASRQPPGPHGGATPRPRTEIPNEVTCVLCDLRIADREFAPPLEMVITRDGSRIWSPPAMVCSHCRTTIRHWRFALAWCSECERWGRRSVVSPCGQLFG